MIPAIDDICIGLLAGHYTIVQAIAWLHQHVELAGNLEGERYEAAKQFAAAWLSIVSHDHDDPCVAGVEANTYGLAQADDLLRRLKGEQT